VLYLTFCLPWLWPYQTISIPLIACFMLADMCPGRVLLKARQQHAPSATQFQAVVSPVGASTTDLQHSVHSSNV
jgi:hypothetical protein